MFYSITVLVISVVLLHLTSPHNKAKLSDDILMSEQLVLQAGHGWVGSGP